MVCNTRLPNVLTGHKDFLFYIKIYTGVLVVWNVKSYFKVCGDVVGRAVTSLSVRNNLDATDLSYQNTCQQVWMSLVLEDDFKINDLYIVHRYGTPKNPCCSMGIKAE